MCYLKLILCVVVLIHYLILSYVQAYTFQDKLKHVFLLHSKKLEASVKLSNWKPLFSISVLILKAHQFAQTQEHLSIYKIRIVNIRGFPKSPIELLNSLSYHTKKVLLHTDLAKAIEQHLTEICLITSSRNALKCLFCLKDKNRLPKGQNVCLCQTECQPLRLLIAHS